MKLYSLTFFWGFPYLVVMTTLVASTRHVIFWNTFETPELAGGSFTKNVEIGDFMDVLCPHRRLLNPNDLNTVSIFNLYNVTEHEFETCQGRDPDNLLFACDRPERENKLTIKFQTISPSPLGFRFQYCQDYYFVAVSHSTSNKTGCHSETSRLRISVACQETTTEKAATTISEKSASSFASTPSLNIDSYIRFLEKLRELRSRVPVHDISNYDDTLLVPQLRPISKEDRNGLQKGPNRIHSFGPPNCAQATFKSHNIICFILGLAVILLSSL